jgi:hypothetical protein
MIIGTWFTAVNLWNHPMCPSTEEWNKENII